MICFLSCVSFARLLNRKTATTTTTTIIKGKDRQRHTSWYLFLRISIDKNGRLTKRKDNWDLFKYITVVARLLAVPRWTIKWVSIHQSSERKVSSITFLLVGDTLKEFIAGATAPPSSSSVVRKRSSSVVRPSRRSSSSSSSSSSDVKRDSSSVRFPLSCAMTLLLFDVLVLFKPVFLRWRRATSRSLQARGLTGTVVHSGYSCFHGSTSDDCLLVRYEEVRLLLE